MSLRSIWLGAWDLDGANASELIAFWRDCGLNACNLGFSYHGGRLLLPRNRRRRIYEQDASALYFSARPEFYRGLRLRPHVAPTESLLTDAFLAAARRADYPVHAWTVICHNDRLGAATPEVCVENVFGDKYTYALCPSHPDVRAYAVAVCADIASREEVAGLDLEALSFMGYEHASLHDKRGVPLTPLIVWLLSVCVCPHCQREFGPAVAAEFASRARAAVTRYLDEWPREKAPRDLHLALEETLGADLLAALLGARGRVLLTLLDEIRAATTPKHLNLRLAGRVDAATISFFGATRAQMAAELRLLPAERFVPLSGGFVFHHPDCGTEEEVRERTALLRAARMKGLLFYCYSMATTEHLSWLRNVLHAE